jgi:hypothetical protein
MTDLPAPPKKHKLDRDLPWCLRCGRAPHPGEGCFDSPYQLIGPVMLYTWNYQDYDVLFIVV